MAASPPSVNPVLSPWLGATQIVSGGRFSLVDRVVVLNAQSRSTATLPMSTTWQAGVALAYGRVNTLTVDAYMFVDTQCE